MANQHPFRVPADCQGQTLAAVVRRISPPISWSEARRLITNRHVRVNGSLCLDDARRLSEGEVVEVAQRSHAPPPRHESVRIVHIDEHLVVVDKPAGMMTLRRGEERDWDAQRKQRQPTLDELLQEMLPGLLTRVRGGGRAVDRKAAAGKPGRPGSLRVRPVHRLDRDTSGLMIFALSEQAEHALIRMFARHKIERTYAAVVHGRLERPRAIETWLVRDRGDGLRGSSPSGAAAADAQHAVTHVKPVEHLGDTYTVCECRLETGRTHQIRIHLAEIGHMLCGEKVYVRAVPDQSGAPRQALHSGELRFVHPMTGQTMQFRSPLPVDLQGWLDRLRGGR